MTRMQTAPKKFTAEIRDAQGVVAPTPLLFLFFLGENPSFTAGDGSFGAQQCDQRSQISREHPAGQDTGTSDGIPPSAKVWKWLKNTPQGFPPIPISTDSVAGKCAKGLKPPPSSAKLRGSAPLGQQGKTPKHSVF